MNNANKIYKSILTISGLIIIFAGLKVADKIVVPFLLSMFIALISFPLLNFFKSKKINTPISVTLVLITIISISLSFAALIGTSINGFRKSLPTYKEKINLGVENISLLAEKLNLNINRIFLVTILIQVLYAIGCQYHKCFWQCFNKLLFNIIYRNVYTS